MKSNSRSYLQHLRNDIMPVMKELYPNNNFIFIQESAPSHRTKIVQDFLRKELKPIFVANTELPSFFPDCKPLDYYFWSEVKEKCIIVTMLLLLRVKKSSNTGFALCETNVLKMLNCFVKQLNSFYHV